MKKILITLCIGLFTHVSACAWGKTVYDPRNFAQNYTTAINAIKTESNTAATLKQQITAVMHQANAVKSLEGLAQITQMTQEYSLFEQLSNIDAQLLETVLKAKEQSDNLSASYAASNLTWEQFVNSYQLNSNRSRQALTQHIQTTQNEMQSVAQRRKKIVQELQTVSGQTQAIQSVGAAIDVLIGQNQQLISSINRVQTDQLQQTYEAIQVRKLSQQRADQYQNGLLKAAKRAGAL